MPDHQKAKRDKIGELMDLIKMFPKAKEEKAFDPSVALQDSIAVAKFAHAQGNASHAQTALLEGYKSPEEKKAVKVSDSPNKDFLSEYIADRDFRLMSGRGTAADSASVRTQADIKGGLKPATEEPEKLRNLEEAALEFTEIEQKFIIKDRRTGELGLPATTAFDPTKNAAQDSLNMIDAMKKLGVVNFEQGLKLRTQAEFLMDQFDLILKSPEPGGGEEAAIRFLEQNDMSLFQVIQIIDTFKAALKVDRNDERAPRR